MTPSQSRILQDILDQRALLRHARSRVDASGYVDNASVIAPGAAQEAEFLDLLGWLVLEALYARSLAAFAGIDRVPEHRPKLRRRVISEQAATLMDLGKELLDPGALGRDRAEILWDGLACIEENFSIGPGAGAPTRHFSRNCTNDLLAWRVKVRRFSVLVDELVSRELP